jgi:gluconolactonase
MTSTNTVIPTKTEAYDERFQKLVPADAQLRQLATGAIWSEGPIYFKSDDSVVWSDIPNNRLLRWSANEGVNVWRSPSNFENGHTLDSEGRLISCEHGRRCISRTEKDGTVVILADRYQGKRLNSPNDLVVKSDGTIWFTDPPYGILSDWEGYKADSELGDNYVFRFDPREGSLAIVTDQIVEPNGLAFSPDERLLYVSDTSAGLRPDGNHIMVFEVQNGSRLGPARLFAEISPGFSDGFKIDRAGNLLTSSLDSVQIYAPDGAQLGKIFIPEKVGNLTFGGPNAQTLFIAASSSLYAIELNTPGARS